MTPRFLPEIIHKWQSKKKTYYKKKAVKGGTEKTQLPQINRKFPAVSIPRPYQIAATLFVGFLTILLIISCVVLSYNYFLQKAEREEALKQLVKAQEIIREHPEQAEAYYTASLYALRVKDFETAKSYLNQALFLNPDMNDARVLLQQVERRL